MRGYIAGKWYLVLKNINSLPGGMYMYVEMKIAGKTPEAAAGTGRLYAPGKLAYCSLCSDIPEDSAKKTEYRLKRLKYWHGADQRAARSPK